MRTFLLGVTALALVTGTAYAQGNSGKNDDKRGGRAEAAQGDQGRGQGNDRAERGRQADGPSMAASMRGSDNRGNADSRGKSDRQERGNDNDDRAERAVERGAQRAGDDRGRGNAARRDDVRTVAVDRGRGRDRDDFDVDIVRVRDARGLASLAPRRLIDGCPPGLAKKNPPCVPPGQVRDDRDWAFDRPDWWGLSGLGSARYFYDDGYLVRMDGGRIGGYIPLLGGALALGNPWPSFYRPVALPDYYVDYYGLGPLDSYRYADNVIYRVDPETALIESVAALLTGDEFAVGRPMPLGYEVYNVPWDYRERYYDRPDALYRYADGYVYQVDPETRLVAAAIELLAS
jgi:hypothetical protein